MLYILHRIYAKGNSGLTLERFGSRWILFVPVAMIMMAIVTILAYFYLVVFALITLICGCYRGHTSSFPCA